MTIKTNGKMGFWSENQKDLYDIFKSCSSHSLKSKQTKAVLDCS